MSLSLPEEQSAKQNYVRSLFDGIASRYDLLNHLLSFGFDILWRKKAIRLLRGYHPRLMLDVATGTCEFAIEAAASLDAEVTGVDISTQMLNIGRGKVRRKGLEHRVRLDLGAAESLNFKAETFDAVTVAFGVRNFSDFRLGLREMRRVLKPGGVALILEFSKPRQYFFSRLYSLYFHRVLPVIGGLVSGNQDSYEYLPQSVGNFPDSTAFLEILRSIGFSATEEHRLTFGIATIYLAIKAASESQ